MDFAIGSVKQILKEIDIKLGDTTLDKEILKDIDSKLNKGEIIENNSNLFSIYVLRSLINKKETISFKYRITAILSLYNSRFAN